ncbi:MAG: hypothetical protein HY814_06765 [Candidatus Riflebacteria bacterium]|nr:hypothetical protein [Candidatus Riflebacteria bacterium]
MTRPFGVGYHYREWLVGAHPSWLYDMRQAQRLRIARRRIKKGAPSTIEWYAERFRVDRRCAAKELMALGFCTAEDLL